MVPALLISRWKLPGAVACTLIACVMVGTGVARSGPVENDGMFITVGNPISENVLKGVKNRVKYAIERQNRSIRTIVFDFNPNGNPSSTSEPGLCTSLATYIRGLGTGVIDKTYPNIKTIAFVHNEVSRHTVLPVLACSDIIMSDELDKKTGRPKARIGDILRDREGDLTGTAEEKAYEIMVRGFPAREVFLKMVRGERRGSWVYADEARKTGLCQAIFNRRSDLAAFLKLPPQSLKEDWLAEGRIVAWRLELQGPLTRAKTESFRRRIGDALKNEANLIIFYLDSPEGDTRDAGVLADYISKLSEKENRPVKTVAFIPGGTQLGAATLIALACNEIYMGSGSSLGDFAYLRNEPPNELHARQEMLLKLARDQGFPEVLFQAMLDPKLVLYKARSIANPGEFRVMTEQQLDKEKQEKNPRWQAERRLNPETGKLLRLDAALAKELRIVGDSKVESLDDLYALIPDLDSRRIRVSRVDWLDSVADFFREPIVNVLLIMLGIIGLTLELKMPGTTLPGILGAICFVLFFWAYSFVGQFTMLAVLLFVLGLILLAFEIFVVPGFGVPGISGVLLVIGSLVLVTLERMPQSSGDWLQLGGTLTMFGISLVGAIAGAITLAWYLPNIPYMNRLILKPPTETGEEAATPAPLSETRADLLGAIGEAATVLRPAGKARFGDEFLDVSSQGEYVNPGSRVQIIEIEGNRIVVKEV